MSIAERIMRIKRHYKPRYELLNLHKSKIESDGELWKVYNACLIFAKKKSEIGIIEIGDVAKWPLRKFKPFKKSLSEIINNSILDNKGGIFLYSSNNNNIINSTISNSSSRDFCLRGESDITAINTTFNKNQVYIDDELSYFTIKWYLSMWYKFEFKIKLIIKLVKNK